MAKVTVSKSKGPRMETHRITIEKAHNGFSVKSHKRPSAGASRESLSAMNYMDHDEPPAVFTKHAPAVKHIQNAMQDMHPVLPPPDGPDVSTQPSEPAAGSAPMESV
jgi:hypothetical protein